MNHRLNYGAVGNCRTAALISETGNIEWLCLPEFDSPSIFAALLDREKGGCFGFEVSEAYRTEQSYIPHTNILSTRTPNVWAAPACTRASSSMSSARYGNTSSRTPTECTAAAKTVARFSIW